MPFGKEGFECDLAGGFSHIYVLAVEQEEAFGEAGGAFPAAGKVSEQVGVVGEGGIVAEGAQFCNVSGIALLLGGGVEDGAMGLGVVADELLQGWVLGLCPVLAEGLSELGLAGGEGNGWVEVEGVDEAVEFWVVVGFADQPEEEGTIDAEGGEAEGLGVFELDQLPVEEGGIAVEGLPDGLGEEVEGKIWCGLVEIVALELGAANTNFGFEFKGGAEQDDPLFEGVEVEQLGEVFEGGGDWVFVELIYGEELVQ